MWAVVTRWPVFTSLFPSYHLQMTHHLEAIKSGTHSVTLFNITVFSFPSCFCSCFDNLFCVSVCCFIPDFRPYSGHLLQIVCCLYQSLSSLFWGQCVVTEHLCLTQVGYCGFDDCWNLEFSLTGGWIMNGTCLSVAWTHCDSMLQ